MDQAGLKAIQIPLSLPQECWDWMGVPLCLARFFFLFTCLCVPTGILLHHVYASACKSQRRVLDLLELELQVSHVMWVLGNTLRSSERAVRAHKG